MSSLEDRIAEIIKELREILPQAQSGLGADTSHPRVGALLNELVDRVIRPRINWMAGTYPLRVAYISVEDICQELAVALLKPQVRRLLYEVGSPQAYINKMARNCYLHVQKTHKIECTARLLLKGLNGDVEDDDRAPLVDSYLKTEQPEPFEKKDLQATIAIAQAEFNLRQRKVFELLVRLGSDSRPVGSRSEVPGWAEGLAGLLGRTAESVDQDLKDIRKVLKKFRVDPMDIVYPPKDPRANADLWKAVEQILINLSPGQKEILRTLIRRKNIWMDGLTGISQFADRFGYSEKTVDRDIGHIRSVLDKQVKAHYARA